MFYAGGNSVADCTNVQGCDTTMMRNTTTAGYQKMIFIVLLYGGRIKVYLKAPPVRKGFLIKLSM